MFFITAAANQSRECVCVCVFIGGCTCACTQSWMDTAASMFSAANCWLLRQSAVPLWKAALSLLRSRLVLSASCSHKAQDEGEKNNTTQRAPQSQLNGCLLTFYTELTALCNLRGKTGDNLQLSCQRQDTNKLQFPENSFVFFSVIMGQRGKNALPLSDTHLMTSIVSRY